MRWEYIIRIFQYNDVPNPETGLFRNKPFMTITNLNVIGNDGWEMCGFHEHEGKGFRCVFKRPAPEPVEQAPAVEI